jgi:hypothetical protein
MKFIHVLCATSTLLLAAACGDNDTTPAGTGGTSSNSNSNSNNNNNTPEPGTAADDVTATEGGEVALDDGAGVNIPAGALSDDTEISIESSEPDDSLPNFDSIQGLAYEFGPDGTTFEVPVELTLPLVGTPGADEAAVVSWLNTETNQWEDLETTTSGDTVTAETTHFTLFVVRFVGVEAGAFDCAFEACEGGNIVGTWNIQGACVDTEGFENPFEATCPEATVDIASNLAGSVTFNDDGTFTSSITNGGIFTFSLPASCSLQLAQGMDMPCQDAFGSDPEDDDMVTCTGTTAEGCDCTQTSMSETNEGAGTYTVNGTSFATVEEGEGSQGGGELCITGDTLKVSQVEGGGDGGTPTTIVWVAERQ